MTPEDQKWFRVEVSDHAGQIVCIESGSLSGRDIGDDERQKIHEAIAHLCGFVGPDIEQKCWACGEEKAHADGCPMVDSTAAETSAAQPFTPKPVSTWEPNDGGLCKRCGLSWFLHIAEDEHGRANVCTSIKFTSEPVN